MTRANVTFRRPTESQTACERYAAMIAAEDYSQKQQLKGRKRRSLILACLREHAAGKAILPSRAAFELVEAITELDTGRVLDLVRPRKGSGGRYSARQIAQINDGLKYIEAARLDIVQDKTARNTVAIAFGVTVGLVGYWIGGLRTGDLRMPAQQTDVSLITIAMQKSGARFSARLKEDAPTKKAQGRKSRSLTGP